MRRIVNVRGFTARTWTEFIVLCVVGLIAAEVVRWLPWVLLGALIGCVAFWIVTRTTRQEGKHRGSRTQ